MQVHECQDPLHQIAPIKFGKDHIPKEAKAT